MAAEAINHALAAADYPPAVELAGNPRRRVVLQGYAQTVESWLHRLPAAWRTAGPRANLAFAWSLLLRGQLGEIEPYLRNAEAAAEHSQANGLEDAPALLAEALALRAGLVSLRGDTERGCAIAQEAVALAPAADPYVCSMAYFCLGTAYNYAGKSALAIEFYRLALPLCQAAENTVATMLIVANLAMLYIARGQLHAAAELCQEVIATSKQAGDSRSPALASVYGAYGELLYAWDHWMQRWRRRRRDWI